MSYAAPGEYLDSDDDGSVEYEWEDESQYYPPVISSSRYQIQPVYARSDNYRYAPQTPPRSYSTSGSNLCVVSALFP